VVDYVDRQVRKEMIDAVKQGDVLLLSNFLDRFGRCVTERPESMANFRSEATGDTVLHLALLMNYDTKEYVHRMGQTPKPQKNAPTASDSNNKSPQRGAKEAPAKGGIGGAFQGIFDLRQIKTALSNESQTSFELKCQIAEMLVTRAAADPSIRNFHHVTPLDIAKSSPGAARLREVLRKAKNK